MNKATEFSKRLPKFKLLFDPTNHRMVHPIYNVKEIEKIE